MQRDNTPAASRRQHISFEDVYAATLCLHIAYWRSKAEDRAPQVSEVLRRFLEVNPSNLSRLTARLLVAILLHRSPLVDAETKVALLKMDAELRQWLAANPE
jgi:hypothetical protein